MNNEKGEGQNKQITGSEGVKENEGQRTGVCMGTKSQTLEEIFEKASVDVKKWCILVIEGIEKKYENCVQLKNREQRLEVEVQ